MGLLDHLGQVLREDASVDGRGFEASVAEELLHVAHVGAALNEVRGVGVPEDVAA